MNGTWVLESVHEIEASAEAHFGISTRNKLLLCFAHGMCRDLFANALSTTLANAYFNNDKVIMGKALCYDMILAQYVAHTHNPSTLKEETGLQI